MNKGATPNIVAGAYTNSYAGTEKTALYNIDGTAGGTSCACGPVGASKAFCLSMLP